MDDMVIVFVFASIVTVVSMVAIVISQCILHDICHCEIISLEIISRSDSAFKILAQDDFFILIVQFLPRGTFAL